MNKQNIEELEKLKLKREIYSKNLSLIRDSLTNEEISPEFQSLDIGFYKILQRKCNIYHKKKMNRTDLLIKDLFNNKKIVLGVC